MRTHFADDMLIVNMHGGLTTAEETMLSFGETDAVRAFRQVFHNHMTAQLTAQIEELTGRAVRTYQTQILFEPTRVVQIFVLDDATSDE